MSKLNKIAKNIDIDWTSTIYAIDAGTRLTHDFNLNPIDFLNFAKGDISIDSERGLVNSLSNAKRCIDCEIDKFILATGIDIENINATNFINNSPVLHSKEASFKLKLLWALNIAPAGIVSKYRKLRHSLEHEYRLPAKGDVIEAIELAQMFMGCVDNSLNVFVNYFAIGSKKYPMFTKNRPSYYSNILRVVFEGKKGFQIRSYQPNNTKTCIITNKDPEYIPLIQISIVLGLEQDIRQAHTNLIKSMNLTTGIEKHKPEVQI